MERATVTFAGARQVSAPATCAQRQIWTAISKRLPDAGFYSQLYRVTLYSGPTLSQVLAAVRDVVAAHESLRTTVSWDGGQLVQHVLGSGEVTVDLADLEPGQTSGEAFREWERVMLRTGFRFEVDVPVRVLVAGERGVPVLAGFCVSHLSVDLTALRVVVAEFLARLGGARPLPEYRPPVEHAAYERSPRGRRALDRGLAYWRRHTADAPPPAFPEQRSGHNATLAMDSPAAAAATLVLARRYQVSSGAVLLAAASRVLGRAAGQAHVGLRLLVANRFAPELRTAVANLHQEVPVTVAVDAPFGETARTALRVSLAAYARGHYDPDEVAEVVREHQAENAFPLCFNDIREKRGVLPASVDMPLPPTSQTVLTEHQFQEAEPFFLTVDGDESRWLRFLLSTDTAAMPPEEARRFLLALEAALVGAASSPPT
ncbi:hypothetical protein JOF53_000778 [Crossiella equi]|uniref:Condensation domain-containing protein n=1 Tax=Crossiella equi TaxID=130796 RepID=A0ABS5A6G7_9PSEU|nr:condensation domain-containing protein [Crossiella equi]MBP2471906.1 hypothetical protein [Crossiella equi]